MTAIRHAVVPRSASPSRWRCRAPAARRRFRRRARCAGAACRRSRARSLLQAVTKAGDRLVAVGQRGHVVYLGDGGATWKQSQVPVSSDLTAVFFVDDKQGWAVGHDGVVLHTDDGGDTWALQLDGRTANELLVAAMERKVAAEPASETPRSCSPRRERYKEQGARQAVPRRLVRRCAERLRGRRVQPDLSHDRRRQDVGRRGSTAPTIPKFFNLYAIRPAAGELYIAGEGGLVLKLDAARAAIHARLTMPYNGSFFGMADAGNVSARRSGCAATSIAATTAARPGPRSTPDLPAAVVGAARTRRRRDAARRRGRPRRGERRRRPHVRERGAQAADAAHRDRRRRRRHACARRPARRRGRAKHCALTLRSRKDASTWPPLPIDLEQMPVVRDLADFDRNSGNALERLVFNNRLPMVVVCALVTRGARLRRGDEARAQRELREDDSAEPAVHQELPRRTRRTCAAWATRCASSSRTPTATSSTRATSTR